MLKYTKMTPTSGTNFIYKHSNIELNTKWNAFLCRIMLSRFTRHKSVTAWRHLWRVESHWAGKANTISALFAFRWDWRDESLPMRVAYVNRLPLTDTWKWLHRSPDWENSMDEPQSNKHADLFYHTAQPDIILSVMFNVYK